jgi:hypothetical protein
MFITLINYYNVILLLLYLMCVIITFKCIIHMSLIISFLIIYLTNILTLIYINLSITQEIPQLFYYYHVISINYTLIFLVVIMFTMLIIIIIILHLIY